jgi:hypothetical protein
MVLALCPACRSPVAFANANKTQMHPCPNCYQSFAVPEESLSEEEAHEVIKSLHRWARDTDQIYRDTIRS